MKLPRLTTRHLLALVALVSLGLGFTAWMERRGVVFQREAARHMEAWLIVGPNADDPRLSERAKYNLRMARKYHLAAGTPWMPVSRDPPMPGPDPV